MVSGQTVGLVLSGGGAKGLYHIGVLKALEEHNIPIDYVSGTSMGAIVAGLYAIGYTPDEMWEIFQSDQVGYWMSGKIPDKYLYYFRQPRRTAHMVNLRLDVNNPNVKAALPSNIIPSNQIDMAFIEFFSGANAQCGGDFDKLFVPFRCVGTDASTREGVVFRSGDIGKAVRASMTIPFVFSPIEIDSVKFYDGGLANNFPWQVLKEDFNPDILLGSRCATNSHESDNALEQIFSLMMDYTDFSLPDSSDVLVQRVFTEVTMMDFNKVDYIVGKGYEDALGMMPDILARIERRADSVDLACRRLEFRAAMPELVFDHLKVTGLNSLQEIYMDHTLGLHPEREQDVFTFDEFRTNLFQLLSEGEMTCGYPDVTYHRETGFFDISLNATHKPSLKLMFGGNISSTSMNQAYIGLEYKTIRRRSQTVWLDGYLSPLYTSVILGGRTDFYRKSPFAVDYSFNYNYYNFFRSNFGTITRVNDLSYNKYEDTYFTVGASMPTGRFTVLSLRANSGIDNYRYYQQPNYSDDDIMDRTKFDYGAVRLQLDRNDLNYLMYPTRGIRQTISGGYIIGKENYKPGTFAPEGGTERVSETHGWFVGSFVREHYMSFTNWLSFGYHVEALISNHPNFSNEYSTNLTSPSFTPTTHSQTIYLRDFRGDSYLAGGVMPTIEFGPNLYLKSSVYAFVKANGDLFKDDFTREFRMMYNSSLVYQTPVGAASLTIAKYNTGAKRNWFLTFNFGYAIFNRKGLFY